ncbi:trimethylamine methyltransferase family protein [Candidatus Poribacteria bacterium]|nr:trimethylamine methyltransferase family protein [Candidatus Poribacteria bacterium]
MKTRRFEVLSEDEIQKIHEGSLTVLAEKGVKVEADDLRDLFRKRGALVNDTEQVVRIPEEIVLWAIEQAPSGFMVYGHDPNFKVRIDCRSSLFCGLGTPTHMLDSKGNLTLATLEDLRKHIILIDDLENLTNDQMDIWPGDIPMTTIHVEAARVWAREARKPFGTGTLGYLATKDTVDMTAMIVGGIDELMKRPRLVGICSVVSPLKIDTAQGHGMKVFAEHNQPLIMAPEAMAGTTAPVTLAGLLVQHNAEVLAHITLAQIINPGAPVLWGTVSTVADMRTGNVAIGSFETGLITAACAQIARYYNIPSRGVGGTTDSKLLDVQCGFERMMNLFAAYMSGINYITCMGTLERTVVGSHELMVLDNEIAGMLKRIARGIEVNDTTLAVDLIKNLDWSENYMNQMHTAQHFRSELYLSDLIDHNPRDAWESAGSKGVLDRCADKVEKIIANHKANKLSGELESKMQKFIDEVAARPLEEFYKYEGMEAPESPPAGLPI